MQPLPNRLALFVPGPAQWLATVSALCDLLILLHHPSSLSLSHKSIEVDARSPRPSLSFIALVYQAHSGISISNRATSLLPFLIISSPSFWPSDSSFYSHPTPTHPSLKTSDRSHRDSNLYTYPAASLRIARDICSVTLKTIPLFTTCARLSIFLIAINGQDHIETSKAISTVST